MAKSVVAIRIEEDLLNRVIAVGGKDRSAAILKCIEAGIAHAHEPDPNQIPLFSDEDRERINHQREKVFDLMKDGRARTLEQIAKAIGAPATSIPAISARLRDARKRRYGAHTVEKQQLRPGLFEYRLIVRAA